MRVLLIIDLGYEAGGAEKSVKLMRDELIGRGHQVLVVSTDIGLDHHDSFADAIVPAITGNAIQRLSKHAWYGKGRRQIRSVVQRFRPDVVHMHAIGAFSPSVFWALEGVPAFLTVHGPEEYILGLLPWQLVPSDYRDETYDWHDVTFTGRLRYWYHRALQRPLFLVGMRRITALVVPSVFMAQMVKPDAGPLSVRQVYNGIHLPEARPVPEAPELLYVGRLEPMKGVDVLVRAMAVLGEVVPEATLVVVGDGTAKQRLETLTVELGVTDRVRFTGWVDPAQVPDYFGRAQVLVVPSVGPDTLPTVAIEAMATGRPIVGSAVGGIPELIDDGVTGRIVEPRDVDGLAGAAADILSDRRVVRQMSEAAVRKSVMFSIGPFIDRLEELYSEAAGLVTAPSLAPAE